MSIITRGKLLALFALLNIDTSRPPDSQKLARFLKEHRGYITQEDIDWLRFIRLAGITNDEVCAYLEEIPNVEIVAKVVTIAARHRNSGAQC